MKKHYHRSSSLQLSAEIVTNDDWDAVMNMGTGWITPRSIVLERLRNNNNQLTKRAELLEGILKEVANKLIVQINKRLIDPPIGMKIYRLHTDDDTGPSSEWRYRLVIMVPIPYDENSCAP